MPVTDSDACLIDDIKQHNSSASLQDLSQKHAGIFLQIAKRYTGGTDTIKFPLEEILDQREAIVFEAVKDFDPSKGCKFATWLGSKLKYYCLNSFHAKTRYVPYDPETMQSKIDSEHIHDGESRDRKDLEINYILSVLERITDQRVRHIIHARYFSDNKKHGRFAHIAEELNMSTQGVIDLHNKFIEFMRRKVAATDNMDLI